MGAIAGCPGGAKEAWGARFKLVRGARFGFKADLLRFI